MKQATTNHLWGQLLTVVLVLLIGSLPEASAQTTENFDAAMIMPEGWSVSAESTSEDYCVDRDGDIARSKSNYLQGYVKEGTDKYVVTPKMTGAFSFYFKRQNSSNGSVSVYAIEDDGTLSSEPLVQLTSKPTTWTLVSGTVPGHKQLAIIFYGRIDDFTYTEPGNQTTGLTITDFATTTPQVTTDAEGRYKATFSASVMNTGIKDLTADDKVTLSLLNAQSKVVATSNPVVLAAGATAQVTLSYTERVNADGDFAFYVKENLSGKRYPTAATVSVTLFGPRFSINATEGELQDFGLAMKGASAQKTFTITNSGNHALSIEASVPEGFTADNITVGAGQTADYTVSMNTATAGAKSGTLQLLLNATGITSFSLPLSGYVADTEKFYADFDDNQLPAGWEQGDCTWNFVNGEACGVYSVEKRKNSEMTTPVLTVAEGEEMVFVARALSSFPELTIWYRTDGSSQWTSVKYGDQLTSSRQLLTLNGLAAGNYILRFEGYSVAIDAISGFTANDDAPILSVLDAAGQTISAHDFGTVKAGTTEVFTVKNIGTGILKCTVQASEGFSVEPVEIYLEAGQTQDIAVTLDIDGNYGSKTGRLIFKSEGLTDVVVAMTALTEDPEALMIDFQSQEFPNGWTASQGASVVQGNWDSTLKDYNYYVKAMGNDTIITQRLKVTEAGQALIFDARLVSWLWEDESSLVVAYAEEKANNEKDWHTAKTIELTDDFTTFVVDNLPVGEYYFRFVGSYFMIDNVRGLKIAQEPVPTGISSPSATVKPHTGKAYNLNGQRADRMRKGPLYIIDGKKVLIK